MMKIKYELEYFLNSSPKILYNMLSTPAGLSGWFADDVNVNGNVYTFIWGKSSQEAKETARKDNLFVRFQWLEEEGEDTYFEFRIRVDDLTGDVTLIIIDFVEEDEKDDSIDLWNTQIAALKHLLGL